MTKKMRTIAEQKRCLIVPEGGLPSEWPTDWAFPPPPWPPGWPLKITTPRIEMSVTTFLLHAARGMPCIRVLDEDDEPTDELNGHFIHFIARADATIVRMRLRERDPWSRQALVRIGGGGVKPIFYFEEERMPSGWMALCATVYGTRIRPAIASLRFRP